MLKFSLSLSLSLSYSVLRSLNSHLDLDRFRSPTKRRSEIDR